MQAVVYAEYGTADVLELKEIVKPTPKDDEVLIEVRAASINDWDWGLLQGTPFANRLQNGLRKPKRISILGSDVAGRIETVGRNAERFQPGDAVFGDLTGTWGGFAEYVCAPESAIALKPASMAFEEAAALPQAGVLAIQGLRDKGQIRAGQTLLINGAGGGVGTLGVQIAKTHGVEVTGVDSSAKLDMMRSIGFDHVMDYVKEDFTRSGQRYDLILDNKMSRSVFDCLRALNPNGVYVTTGGSTACFFQALLLSPAISMFSTKRARFVLLRPNKDLSYLSELFVAGQIKPVIDGPYRLRELPEAMRSFGAGNHRGKVVIAMGQ